MSGWLILLLLIGASAAALYLLRVRSGLLTLAGAALFLAGAGYALQGRPGLGGAPQGEAVRAEVIPLTGVRRAFYGEFAPHAHWLIIADSYARRGKTADAVGVLKNAAERYPGDSALWAGLGNALVDHAGVITPAAQLAYGRAAELAPGHPAPPFFLGLALARSGDPAGAVELWRAILAEAPADASWRPLVEDALMALAADVRGQQPPAAPAR